jgi:hypothetical protein
MLGSKLLFITIVIKKRRKKLLIFLSRCINGGREKGTRQSRGTSAAAGVVLLRSNMYIYV